MPPHDDVAVRATASWTSSISAQFRRAPRLPRDAQPPWGLALAPSTFGPSARPARRNFGDGNHAFNPTTGAFLGQLNDASNQPIVIDGLVGAPLRQQRHGRARWHALLHGRDQRRGPTSVRHPDGTADGAGVVADAPLVPATSHPPSPGLHGVGATTRPPRLALPTSPCSPSSRHRRGQQRPTRRRRRMVPHYQLGRGQARRADFGGDTTVIDPNHVVASRSTASRSAACSSSRSTPSAADLDD